MPTNGSSYGTYCLGMLIDAALEDELIVERRTWKSLLVRPKAHLSRELKRLGLSPKQVGDCTQALSNDGEEQIAVISVGRGGHQWPNEITIAADQDQLIGAFDPRTDFDLHIPDAQPTPKRSHGASAPCKAAHTRPYLIPIVQKILADGKPRSAQQILEIGIAQGLLPKTMLRKNLYGHLVQYIERTKAHDRKPLIIQNQTDRTFTINQPPDDWPDIPTPEPPDQNQSQDPQRKAVIETLTKTSTGTNPTDFEIAVCEAFEYLGYIAKHIGGERNPDGVIDAPLGPKAYRSMIECKTSVKGLVQGSGFVTEAIKYKDEYHADYCAVIGPKFEQLGTLDAELQTHKVALWTVADLVRILSMATNPYETIPLFDPGRASNVLDDIEWERRHGRAKRVRTIANVLLEEGWKAQVLAAKEGPREEAPLLNEDAAMMLVDAWLEKQGAQTGCTRADVRAAFDYLTSPLVARAIDADANGGAIVLLGSPSIATVAVETRRKWLKLKTPTY